MSVARSSQKFINKLKYDQRLCKQMCTALLDRWEQTCEWHTHLDELYARRSCYRVDIKFFAICFDKQDARAKLSAITFTAIRKLSRSWHIL